MAAHNDWGGPAGHKTRYVLANDRLTEDNAAEDVADRAVGRAPHLLQPEFLDALFVRRDRRAFHADADFLDLFGRVDGDLIFGAITFFDTQIVVQQVKIQIG